MQHNIDGTRFELWPVSESDRKVLMLLKEKFGKKLPMYFSYDLSDSADVAGLVLVLEETDE